MTTDLEPDPTPAPVRSRGRDITPTREHVDEARGWIADCEWKEAEYGVDPAEEYADEEIVRGVDRHYAGGWDEFLISSGFKDRPQPEREEAER